SKDSKKNWTRARPARKFPEDKIKIFPSNEGGVLYWQPENEFNIPKYSPAQPLNCPEKNLFMDFSGIYCVRFWRMK
ncbi:MAG: hypothetical protein WAN11_28035, partial [Syntrophobacteraceae bacterium]